MGGASSSSNNTQLYASVGVGLISVGAIILFRPSRRNLAVEALLPRDHKSVFQFHLNPTQFYSVLRFSKDNLNKQYEVLDMKRTSNKIDYTLSHVVTTAFGKKDIRSNPVRFNINENDCRFEETFTVLKTTFLFQYKFSNEKGKCKIDMDIILTGPYLLTRFFGRVKSDFENRFRITNDNIDQLLP